MKRKICVITGSRADYGIFVPVMRAIQKSKSLKLYIIATCMHLMKEFGYTAREIEKDGFDICEKVNILCNKDSGQAMAFSIGKAVSSLSRSFERIKPDIVVVLGDRGEMLAAAIAANYMNIPVAHIHGGEISGHVDGVIRHAITKLSHIHFAATQRAKEIILKLGEQRWRVFNVGAPALDCILSEPLPSKEYLFDKFELDIKKPLALFIQHPVSTGMGSSIKVLRNTLNIIKSLGLQTIVFYPNADAGGRMMIKIINKFKKHHFIKIFKSIPHKNYLGLLKSASVLIGNSSSGIIEAPSFKLPVVNIGERQIGRQRSINVIDVSCAKNAIKNAIIKALYDNKFRKKVKLCKNPYGNGKASKRITEVISSIKLNENLLKKQITY
ncbi:MAG: UDP-N-acetylglucosamine 2-epimerase [Candidatus Omnitrophica bacterium]|nr:UDP-N-acetylglucosamine 2-epimerase [Candidatus Omnitrophota bacterium]